MASKLNPNAGEFVPTRMTVELMQLDGCRFGQVNGNAAAAISVPLVANAVKNPTMLTTSGITWHEAKGKKKKTTNNNYMKQKKTQPTQTQPQEKQIKQVPFRGESDMIVKLRPKTTAKHVYSIEHLMTFKSKHTYLQTNLLSDVYDPYGVFFPQNTHSKKKKGVSDKRKENTHLLSFDDHCSDLSSVSSSFHTSPFIIVPTSNPKEEAQKASLRVNSLINKLSEDNFTAILTQFKEVEVTCILTLKAVAKAIFDRAISEPGFCDLYAQLCADLSQKLPEFKDGARAVSFRRDLLEQCYCSLVEAPIEMPTGNEELSRKTHNVLGKVVFIGQLFRRQMLTENIMHMCIAMLLDEACVSTDKVSEANETYIEAACRLIMLVGDGLDGSNPASKHSMDDYFGVLEDLLENSSLPRRIRFLVADTVKLRSLGWVKLARATQPPKHKKDEECSVQDESTSSSDGSSVDDLDRDVQEMLSFSPLVKRDSVDLAIAP